jgi:NADH-quinone oxidoreductase subunit N
VKYATFVPEAMVVAAAVVLLLMGRFRPAQLRRLRSRLPAWAAIVLLIALGIELYVGGNVGSYFGGGLVQDRLALFAKAAGLLAAATAIAVADWPSEESPSVAIAMSMLALFGLMVIASAGDVVGVWAGLELAGAAGVAALAVRRPDLGLRLLVLGAAASAMTLLGLAYVYATAGTADLLGIRLVLLGTAPTLPLALPVLILLGALAFRAAVTPAQVAAGPALPPASPLSTGLVVGLVAAAALVAAVKIAAALSPVSGVYSPYLEVVAGLAMVGGGAAALAVRTPRARIAFLAAGQAGWVLAGLATHDRGGIGSAVFLLGAFVVAATAGPAAVGATGLAEAALAGMATLRPHRAAALTLALLSLAGAPPLAGFFGEFAIGSALARSGHFELVALGLLGTLLSVMAALGTLRVMYLQNPLDEARRGAAALPVWTRLSAGAAIAICVVMMAYGLFASPILALADQSAEGLGLK